VKSIGDEDNAAEGTREIYKNVMASTFFGIFAGLYSIIHIMKFQETAYLLRKYLFLNMLHIYSKNG